MELLIGLRISGVIKYLKGVIMPRKTSQYRLNGINPLSYMGVNPTTPPDHILQDRIPRTTDIAFVIGTVWQLKNSLNIWMLASVVDGIANWISLSQGNSSGATHFPTNSGTAIEVTSVLNILGSNVITTTGSGNTVTIAVVNGTNGQVLIGGGGAPAWANITSLDSSMTITNGPNSIDLSVTGGEGANKINADTGFAIPVNGEINLLGGELINTSGSGNTVLVNLDRGTNGQIPIASNSGATIYANITSLDSSVTIANGANTIDLSATAPPVPTGRAAFFYYQNGNWGTAGNPAPYYLGKYLAMTQLYDFGSNCTTGNGSGTPAKFTAPENGIYILGMGINIPTTGVGNFGFIETPSGNLPLHSNVISNDTPMSSVVMKLSMGDIVQFGIVFTGASVVAGSAGTPYWYTYFWGYQIST